MNNFTLSKTRKTKNKTVIETNLLLILRQDFHSVKGWGPQEDTRQLVQRTLQFSCIQTTTKSIAKSKKYATNIEVSVPLEDVGNPYLTCRTQEHQTISNASVYHDAHWLFFFWTACALTYVSIISVSVKKFLPTRGVNSCAKKFKQLNKGHRITKLWLRSPCRKSITTRRRLKMFNVGGIPYLPWKTTCIGRYQTHLITGSMHKRLTFLFQKDHANKRWWTLLN